MEHGCWSQTYWYLGARGVVQDDGSRRRGVAAACDDCEEASQPQAPVNPLRQLVKAGPRRRATVPKKRRHIGCDRKGCTKPIDEDISERAMRGRTQSRGTASSIALLALATPAACLRPATHAASVATPPSSPAPSPSDAPSPRAVSPADLPRRSRCRCPSPPAPGDLAAASRAQRPTMTHAITHAARTKMIACTGPALRRISSHVSTARSSSSRGQGSRYGSARR